MMGDEKKGPPAGVSRAGDNRENSSVLQSHTHDKVVADLTDEEVRAAIEAIKAEPSVADASELDRHFLYAPTHGLGADLIYQFLGDTTVCELESGEFYTRHVGSDYYAANREMKRTARRILESAIDRAFASERRDNMDDPKKVFEAAGTAYRRARTKEFLTGALALFAERVTREAIPWNAEPETLCTVDGVVDFSGDRPEIRRARLSEFYRDPIPTRATAIVNAPLSDSWGRYLEQVFPDPDTRKMALQCFALIVRGSTTKTFQLWTNAEGHGGKNSTVDVLSMCFPGRIRAIAGAVILKSGDSSERRFGVAELETANAAVFDEVGGTFDIAAVKRLTSLSPLRVERKGEHPKEIQPTWAPIALCNELPRFTPADDTAFLSRLLVLPFQSIFYPDDETRKDLIERGIDPARLHPARRKDLILNELREEIPSIIASIIDAYIDLRENYELRPAESSEARQARQVYRTENDDLKRFVDEYLVIDPDGFITNDRLEALYRDFSGDPRPRMKRIRADISRRWTETKTTSQRVAEGTTTVVKRGIAGLRENDE